MLIEILTSTILGLGALHEAGFQGQGVTIAVIDGGFYHYDDTTAMPKNQIKGVYDLIEPDYHPGDITECENETHGTMCLSTMLFQGAEFVGTAPKANFLLIRTEDINTEYPYEADRLIKGMELADSLGANIITISLGYSEFDDPTDNYTYEDLDGQLPVSRKATELVHKGTLVCVSAGNSGNLPWRYITPPADAEDILTVGAVNENGILATFSSVGPTADGRLKPDVVAWGQQTIIYNSKSRNLQRGNGTSFSCPEVAGMAASLWSAMPSLSALELRDAILQSASQAGTPNNEMGHGIPNAWLAYQNIAQGMFNPRPTHDQPTKLIRGTEGLIIVTPNGNYDVVGRRVRK